MPVNPRLSPDLIRKMQDLCATALAENGIEVCFSQQGECLKLRQQIYSCRKQIHKFNYEDNSPISLVEMRIVGSGSDWKLLIQPQGTLLSQLRITNRNGEPVAIRPSAENQVSTQRQAALASVPMDLILEIKDELEAAALARLPGAISEAEYSKLDSAWLEEAKTLALARMKENS